MCFLHLVALISLFVGILALIDGHAFQTGSPVSIYQIRIRLLKTQINELLSLVLVMVRFLATSCSALLV